MGVLEEKGDLKLDSNGVFGVRKRFLGVFKKNNRWGARIQHPKLKFEVYLGSYSTPEEAALVVKKKKVEFEEMFKGGSSMNGETYRDGFEGMKLPSGVFRRGYRSWRVQIWHPKLKREVRLGCYSTPEEAALVADKKRADFWKMYGWRPRVKPYRKESKDNEFIIEKPKRAISDEMSGDQKVPSGLRKLKWKWGARIRDPKTRPKFGLGTSDIDKDAVKSLNKAKTELAVKRKRAEFDGLEFTPKVRAGFEANEGPMKIECEADLNTIAILPAVLECNFVQYSPTLRFEPQNSNNGDAGDTCRIRKEDQQKSGCDFDFEEAMSLGFVNEYGQLIGEYSKLDEQMGFSLPEDCDEFVADIGY